jgi:ribonuclease HI
MPWKPHRLRDSEVWVRIDEAGQMVSDSDGRVDVIYKASNGAKVYRAASRNLAPRDGAVITVTVGEPAMESATAATTATSNGRPAKSANRGKGATTAAAARAAAPVDSISVWTDGGCSPNPGPGGIGVVVIDGTHRIEFGDYLGESTNNICELMAIKRGLESVTARDRTVVIYADSAYAIGLLSQGWKAKANVELVAELRVLCKQFSDLRFVKVAAHVGIKENERVDTLVNRARSARRRVEPTV